MLISCANYLIYPAAVAVVEAGWLCTPVVSSVGVGQWAGTHLAGPVAVAVAVAAEVDFPASVQNGSLLLMRQQTGKNLHCLAAGEHQAVVAAAACFQH